MAKLELPERRVEGACAGARGAFTRRIHGVKPCAWRALLSIVVGTLVASTIVSGAAADERFKLDWNDEILTIRGAQVPGETIEVWYIEAFCQAGSSNRDWRRTVIPHRTKLLERDDNGHHLRLESRLDDQVVVTHDIRAGEDEIDFQLAARNPTDRKSEAHWAQPCIRVDRFTGREQSTYLPSCFVMVDGGLSRLPIQPWAKKARYVPGQVWPAPGVDPDDVNPRPISEVELSDGLIGCFSGDGQTLLATAWEPYQELFQGVIVCIHSDFRIGGLEPGQTKRIRGKIYLTRSAPRSLLERYRRDFPEHQRAASHRSP